jgi:undecaprenyl diphosphate synthase
MRLLERFLRGEVPELRSQGVRVRSIGEVERLSAPAMEALRWAEAETRHCADLDLLLALSYGGRDEILAAVRSLLREGVDPESVDERTFRQRLFAPDVPDPDLLIRTSGELRVSNFLLWQVAYTEIFVTEVLWPDFREAEFRDAVAEYGRRERRFGLSAEQLRRGGGP